MKQTTGWEHRPTWELRNVKRALTYFSFLNTPEQNQRLIDVTAELKRRKRQGRTAR